MPLTVRYLLTLPERGLRAVFAVAGGSVYETAHLLLPRFVRRSRLYEVTAKNALRVAIEFLGGVEVPQREGSQEPSAGRIAAQKTVGNVMELGAIAAWGFSPLWLLAAAADVLNGSRLYLRTLEDELAAAGVLPEDVQFASLEQLIAALAGTAGHAGLLIDLPPLEVEELKRRVAELRRDASSLPTTAELAALFDGLVRTAQHEGRSLLEVSNGVGLAFLTSARRIGRDQIAAPYGEDWQPLRDEGFGAYARRIAGPYGRAALGHFADGKVTLTERLLRRGVSSTARLRDAIRYRKP